MSEQFLFIFKKDLETVMAQDSPAPYRLWTLLGEDVMLFAAAAILTLRT